MQPTVPMVIPGGGVTEPRLLRDARTPRARRRRRPPLSAPDRPVNEHPTRPPLAAQQEPLDLERFRSAPRTGCAFHRQAGSAAKELPWWPPACWYDRRRHLGGSPPCSNEAARVHHAARRRGGRVAARGACAAGRCRWSHSSMVGSPMARRATRLRSAKALVKWASSKGAMSQSSIIGSKVNIIE